jgi:drug/metabolite transporter (DMT)-like permease
MKPGLLYLLITSTAFFWGANFVLAGIVLVDLSPAWAAALRFLIAAALIMATNPLITTLLAAAVLGERPSRRQLAALPVALAGVAVVISHGEWSRLIHLQMLRGDIEMLGANLLWALFNVLSRRLMPRASPIGSNALMLGAGALILLAAALMQGDGLTLPGFNASLALLIMAVGGTVLAYLFWGLGIQQLGAGRTALFLNLVPVFAMLVGGALGTAPTPAQWLGGVLVLGGVSLAMLPRRVPAAA